MELDLLLKDVLNKKLQITTALDIIKEKLAYLEGQLQQISPLELQREEPSIDPMIEEEPEEIRPILYTIHHLSRVIRHSTHSEDQASYQEKFEELREVSYELTAVKNTFQKVTRNSSFGKMKFKGTLRELCIWLDEMQEAGILEVAPGRSAIISCFQVNDRDIPLQSYSVTRSRLNSAKRAEKDREARAKRRAELLGKATNQSSPDS